MNYSSSLRYLNTFTDLEKLAQIPQNPFFNLRRMEHLLEAAGHPERKFFPVLIAGTTGKGSTGFFLESILRANGIRGGYYHSPHVEEPRERIRLQGVMASERLWAEGLSAVRKFLQKKPLPHELGTLTYFEILTFLAILIFAKEKVAVGIFEIGLGGRLDATNILKAPLVILTPIHLDHEAFLGNTVAKIAAEKAAIIKPRNHVVIGKQCPEAFEVIDRAVKKQRGFLWKAGPALNIRLGLAGDFQKMNAGVALKAADVLERHFDFLMTPGKTRKALQARNWKGRMESFRWKKRRVILDGAHNPISLKEQVRSLGRQRIKNAWFVFGSMNDKNSREMLKVLSGFSSRVILTGISGNRAKPVTTLLDEAKGLFKCVLTARNVEEALHLFQTVAPTGSTVVVTGSFYLVGEARRILNHG